MAQLPRSPVYTYMAASQKLFGCQKLQSILLLIHSETKIVSRDNSKNWVNLNNLLVSVPQNKETRNIPYPAGGGVLQKKSYGDAQSRV